MAYRIDIISVQPKLMESPLNHSIVQRAKDKGILEIVLHDLKDYGLGKYRQVDDTVYGGVQVWSFVVNLYLIV